MSANTKGAFFMMASMGAFVVNDTFVKLTGGAVPLFQLIFLRGLLATILVLTVAGYVGAWQHRINRSDAQVILLRGGLEVITAYFFLTALFKMPIGNLTAVMQVVPLTVTLGAALFLKEAVGWRRMFAIGLGLFGVMLIIQPGSDGFNIWSLYAVVAVACVSARDLITRRLSKEVSGIAVTLGTTVSVTIAAGLASLTQEWTTVTGSEAAYIGCSAFFVVGGYFFSIQVMRVGDVAFTAPFRYTGLIGAMIIGMVLFDETPTAMTLLGAAIVVGTGLFTLYRGRALSGA
ncbi:MAG: DMT family transporter [Sulfitobacter sp.]|uniref:DMT family transporter n=1 Tax=Ascidiaceihabitans sp. TaxID=1872644 RepID=UPI0032992441